MLGSVSNDRFYNGERALTTVVLEISESLAFLVAQAMKKDSDYNEGTDYDILQKELEFVGRTKKYVKEVKP